jgi:hypothetical protein
MANELSCYEQAVRKADEHGMVPALCPKMFADTAGEPNAARARYKKLGEPTLGGGDPPPDPLAPTPLQDGDPPALAMSGEDFYHAACVEAHARLKPALAALNRENSATATLPVQG